MRKITEETVEAFRSNKAFKKDNTQVRRSIAGPQLYLHDNLIAKFRGDKLLISDGGYRDINGCISNTTKDRLNGLGLHYGFYIYRKKHVDYLVANGKQIEMDYNTWYVV